MTRLIAGMMSFLVLTGLLGCGQTQADKGKEAAPDAPIKWFDSFHDDDMIWDGIREIARDEFPGVTFRWHYGKLEAVTEKETVTLYGGMPIWSVYFCDLTGDGKPELLVRFESGTTASLLEYVCGFDEASGKVTVEFAGTPGLEYYDNGCLKEMVSHNQGLAGEFWPYSFAKYDPKKGKYEMKGSVDAWSSKEYPTNPFDNNKPFPKAVDAAGDGFVFFISDESFKGAKGPDTPVDTPVYEAWVKGYIGGAEPVKMDWVPATADGIKALETK